MDLGGILGVAAIIVAIFLATIVFLWQSNSQTGRLEARMDRFEERIDAAAGRRPTASELEQARLNGVNSVLTAQTHTHDETLGD